MIRISELTIDTVNRAKAKTSAYGKQRYKKRAEEGRCTMCGGPTDGHLRCSACRAKSNANRHNRNASLAKKGLCYTCGKNDAAEGVQVCNDCRDNVSKTHAKTRKARIDNGKCWKCGKGQLVGAAKTCTKCWWKYTTGLVGYGRSESMAANPEFIVPLMNIMFDQNFRCALSGKRLVPGDNASLDHIKPISTHPELSGEISNLQWVTIEVNRAKRDHEESYFIQLCSDIANYRSVT